MLQGLEAGSQAPAERAPLRPLDAFGGTLSNRAYLSLKEAILSLGYAPGQILRKGQICTALGISRSPVSEALARLAAEGLVEVVPQAGTYVARFSMDEIREGAFIREAIEVAAVERVAGGVGPDHLAALDGNLAVQTALAEAGDTAGFYRADREMHALILSFSGFPRLVQVAETAWLHVDRARRLILPIPGRVADTIAEHRAILAALEARDPARARDAMRHHLRQLMTYLEPLERERPDLFAPR